MIKMKKPISYALALAIGCSLCVPAFAAEGAIDKQLAEVTATVKGTLGIGSEYTEFSGETTSNGILTSWNLSWNSENESLRVECSEEGKVLSYFLNRNDEADSSGSNLQLFPKTNRTEARKTAEEFVQKVLGPGESLEWSKEQNTIARITQHSFSGNILMNGLPSPVSFSVTVDAGSNRVKRYYRSDRNDGYIGGVPGADATAKKDEAASLLKGALKLKAEYVTDENNEHEAALRYLPDDTDSYYVDAKTGKLVNLTETYEKISEEGNYLFWDAKEESEATNDYESGGGGSSLSGAAKPELSQAEEAGIAKLEGVLSQPELDKKLKGITALGLSNQAVISFNYWIDRDDKSTVYADMRYASKDDPEKSQTSVSVNARTGEIQSLYSDMPYDENRTASIDENIARQNAESFLKSLWPTQYTQSELYDSDTDLASGAYNFSYARKANGYFFPENVFNISINVTNGNVCRLNWEYDPEMKFQDVSNIVSPEKALDAWFSSYETTLGYWLIPVALNPNDPVCEPLINEGHKYYYGLGLAYYLDRDDEYMGIDAKTGKPVSEPEDKNHIISYTDIDSTWVKPQAEALAEYGIGFTGGVLEPNKELTQIDLIALLASTQEYYYDPKEESAADNLYSYAYSMGIISSSEREDSSKLTRSETIKLLIDYIGYGEVAKLQNIFKCTFTDAGTIASDFYGYAAIAQGMGLVKGDDKGAFSPNHITTRAEAISMIYNYMNR